jgi:hypothetical protein
MLKAAVEVREGAERRMREALHEVSSAERTSKASNDQLLELTAALESARNQVCVNSSRLIIH